MKYLLEIDSPIDQTEVIFIALKGEFNPNAIKVKYLGNGLFECIGEKEPMEVNVKKQEAKIK